MLYLGVDLAERFSAACLVDSEARALRSWVCDFGAKQDPPNPRKHLPLVEEWATTLTLDALHQAHIKGVHYVAVLVEDVSHFMANPKPAIRAQAVLLNTFYKYFDDVELILPRQWQKHFSYSKKESGLSTKTWAKKTATEFGYMPPVGMDKGKSAVDCRDAYLVARYHRDILAGTPIQVVDAV